MVWTGRGWSAGKDVSEGRSGMHGRGVGASRGEEWGEEWSAGMRARVGARGKRRGWEGKRQKWRAKSLRTPFYQYSIYNQKDVLIIVLIILSHPLRSGHSHFHLEQ